MPEANSLAKDIAKQTTKADKLIAMPGQGWSQPLQVRGLIGRFNWNEPPQYSEFVGGGKVPMFLFVTEDGQGFYTRLEKSKQGGRWENAWHAEDDWHWMKQHPQYIEEVWGNHPVNEALQQAALEGLSYKDMKKRIKSYHTWRSISED